MTIDRWSEARLASLMVAIDSRDAARFVEFLTPDARFRFGNASAVQGRAAIQAAVNAFFQSIAGCRHRVDRTWHGPDTLAVQGEVEYTRLGGGTITLPFANVFVLRGDLIDDYRIYADVAPLFAAP